MSKSTSPMPSIQLAVLIALAKQPGHGYSVFQQVLDDNATFGIYIMPDTIYKTLAQLETRRLIESFAEPHTNLKTYTLTKHGISLLRGEIFRLEKVATIGKSRIPD